MSEERIPSLSWFGRDRTLDIADIEPIRVTRETATEARQFLKKYSGIDIEAFHESVRAELLLSKPLGPRGDCLTAEEISLCIRSHEPTLLRRIDESVMDRVVGHLSSCKYCWDYIELYQTLERRSLARAYSSGVANLPAAAWIGPACYVIQEPFASPRLELSVLTYGERSSEASSASSNMRLTVTSPFESEEVALRQIRTFDRAAIPDVVQINPQHVKQVVGVYRSGEIPELSKVRLGTCGYVSIVHEIGRDCVHSGRVIRFGNIHEGRSSYVDKTVGAGTKHR